MATIKDVARTAGVSQGTVSNVLRGETGVSLDKVKKVEEAIKVLGYKPHTMARSLKTSKSMNVGVVLPSITDPRFSQVFIGIERVLNERCYNTSLYITSEIAENEKKALTMIQGLRMDGVIIATCQPQNSELFEQLLGSGMKMVFLEREVQSKDCNFIGFNNKVTIYNIVEKLLSRGFENIALITGPDEYSCEKHCIDGYREALIQKGFKINSRYIEVTNFNKESAFKAAFRLLQLKEIPDVIIASGTPLAEGILEAVKIIGGNLVKIPEIVCLSEDTWVSSSHPSILKLPREFILMGENAGRILLSNFDNPAFHDSKRVVLDGPDIDIIRTPKLPNAKKTCESCSNETLKVLMLDSSAAYATFSLLADFAKNEGIKVTIDVLDYKNIYEAIKKESLTGSYDVFEVDIPWIPEFADKGLLMNLSEYIRNDPESIEKMIPGILDDFSKYEKNFYALPYWYCSQLLFYRKDLFDSIKYRRMFYEEYKTELRPPKTWVEFNAVAKFFTKQYNPESEVLYGTTLGGKFSSGAVCEFLPRMWAFGGKSFNEEGDVVLCSKETIRALTNYCESFKYASPTSPEHWWGEQVEEFYEGKAAMMMLFSAHATDITDRSKSRVVGNIGFDVIPGRKPLLGGWSLGINNLSSRKEEAYKFIKWACCGRLAIPSTILGGFTPCVEIYRNAELLSTCPWLPKSLEIFDSCSKRSMPKSKCGSVLSERSYEEILGGAVHKSITNLVQPEEAIKEADLKLKELISDLSQCSYVRKLR